MLSMFDIKRLLNPLKDSHPVDDFRVISSWAEYEESSKKAPENRNLEYLCYELEVLNPATGERTHFYKAVKFARVIRLPASAKQSTAFMDMQEQVLAGVHEGNYNFITIIANVIKPVALGLLYLYGVQGVSTDLEEAKRRAHNDFLGFIGMMQATFRVLELKVVEARETEWLREKMYNMDYLTVIRGIPKANKSGENAGNKGIGGNNLNPDAQGTLEEIITGMADYEYVIEILSTPVYMDTLMGWQRRSQEEMTEWYSQLQGQKSLSANLSIPMMYMANVGQSQGWSQSLSESSSNSIAQGESFTSTEGQSVGESLSQSVGQSIGRTESFSITNSVSESITNTVGTSFSENTGISSGFGTNFSEGTSFGTSLSENQSLGQGSSYNLSHGENAGESQNISFGENESTSHNLSEGTNMSTSHNLSEGTNTSTTHSVSDSESIGFTSSESTTIGNSSTVSDSASTSTSNSVSSSSGWNESSSHSFSDSTGWSSNKSVSNGNTASLGASLGVSGNAGSSQGTSTGYGSSGSFSSSDSNSTGYSESTSNSTSNSVSNSHSVSIGESVSYGQSASQSNTHSTSESYGTSTGQSISESYGTSTGQSISESYGTSSGQSKSESYGISTGESLSESWGANESLSISNGVGINAGSSLNAGTSQNIGQSYGMSQSISQSTSHGVTVGQSVGQSVSQSVTESTSTSYGQNSSKSESVSNGQSYTQSNGNTTGTSAGTSGTATLGTSASMGLGPSIGYSKSYQWLDQGVKDLLELLEYQNERIKKALRGQGAFYTYVYIACPSLDALSTAQAVAKSTWQNEYAMVQPLQVLDLTESEQKHLLYHFAAFSSDVTREDVYGVEEYKYCTVLLPEEFVAYTHLPRISEGGVFSIIPDIPKFSVPSMLKGEIYMGTILNPERYTFNNGYRTQFDYRIDESTLLHGYFTGASRSGKTVAAMRFIAELSRIRRRKTGKRLRIFVLDPKQDWRTLARFVEPERFNFYSMGNVNFRPIKINPWKVPKGVWPQLWIDGIIDIYCRAYGLLERGKQMIGDVVYELYQEAGVFDACDKPDWKETVPELSKSVNFTSIYQRMYKKKADLESPNAKGGRAGNDTRDAYARLLDRLSCFNREYSIERRLYGTSDGLGIDDLIGDDDVTVLESKGLENTFKNFMFGAITSGLYKFALAHEGGYLAADQYETVVVIEEANEVLTGNDCAGTGGGQQLGMSGQSEFEQILDQSAGYGMFIFAITQKIADMPSSIIANSGLVFAGRLKRPDDINVVVRAIGREERIDDRDTVKWFPVAPTGWFVCQTSRTSDFKDSAPILVQISRLNINPPSNQELDEILLQKEAYRHLSGQQA